MLLHSFLAIGLAAARATALPVEADSSSPLTPFDLPTVTGTFDKIQSSIDKMVSDINAFTGDKASMTGIVADSADIQKVIEEGVTKIKASPAMGLMDAIGILAPVTTLGNKVDEIVNALASKKTDLEKINATPAVLSELRKQRLVADKLSAAILANLPMPALLGSIAKPIAKQITDKLDAGIKQWGGEPPAAAAH